ncbi:hypothetical protein P280DRAFT_466812 [Massarina eburnea CBS 473.64]|uniref:Uncharacterized protein n=1 Tax=Massarina eburnea CBS 473.64 TaxID=1395130 RepID=A0A6A6S980_9PLEO|nr:hypothetical protein P280DRAFT_466812 [Massarina eburnea CBS 473.64]
MSGIKWMLPIGPQQCAERDQSIACSFQLYSNASTLTETQKLAPNNDITGDAVRLLRQVIKAFIVSNAFALLFSAILLWDRFQWHFLIHNYSDTRLYLRTIHVVQRLLHGLSDHQLVSGLALLVTLNNQACSISAYHYNLACTMLILSAVTHFNSLFSIQDYIHKGRVVAGIRIVAIIVQYVLSAIVLSGRNVKTGFPTKPGSLGIMPAPCFWNTTTSGYWGVRDALDAASLGDKDTTGNATATDTGIETVATSAAFWEYIMLVVFSGFACVFLVAEWIHTSKHGRNIVVKSKLIASSSSLRFTYNTNISAPAWRSQRGTSSEPLRGKAGAIRNL